MKDLPLLELQNIALNYGSVQALKNIDLSLYASEIHAIVGEHGAGKSSIGRIISGFAKPLAGKIVYKQRMYPFLTPKHARKLGIEMVAQQSYLLEDLSVAENLCLNHPRVGAGFLFHKHELVQTVEQYLRSIHIDVPAAELLRNLPLPEKVLVDILRHLFVEPAILILDEALEKLTATRLTKVLPLLKHLKEKGAAIVFITHRIDDIYEYADRVTIIRKGDVLVTDPTANIDKINLIKLAYTQLPKEDTFKNVNTEFYHLLKYNQAILEKLPVNLIVTDREHQIKLFNEQAIQYFEIGRYDFYNMPLETLFSEQNRELFSTIKTALSDKDGKTIYNQPIAIQGAIKMSNIRITPIFDGNFKIGNMIILEDVTEQQQLREQIMFSEKLASVGLLAAGVAHEINNPLEILENCIDYLNLELSDQEQRKALKDIEEVKDSIAQIVSNLVSFSETRPSVDECFDVNVLIEDIINLVRHYSKHRKTHIRFQKQSPLCIKANKNEIKQVIINLLKNSFEAMPDGGEVSIHSQLHTEADLSYAQILVQDNGCGIEADNPSDIFLPFYSTKKIGGHNLGLGLYMSYTLLQKNQGQITVKNLDDSGCQFTLLLPLCG